MREGIDFSKRFDSQHGVIEVPHESMGVLGDFFFFFNLFYQKQFKKAVYVILLSVHLEYVTKKLLNINQLLAF